MSYNSAKLRTTLRKAGWPATPPVSVSPWISTCTRAAASRPRNSLPLRAAITRTVPSEHGRSSRFAWIAGREGHLPARAEELADRHRDPDRRARRRNGGGRLGGAGGV